MRTILVSLVATLALLAAGCGKQPQDRTSGSAFDHPWKGRNAQNVDKLTKCTAAVASKHESVQQGFKDDTLCENKYPIH